MTEALHIGGTAATEMEFSLGRRATRDPREVESPGPGNLKLIVFAVEDLICAMDIAVAQEIKAHMPIVEIPEAPLKVRGVANLRGQVVTVIDLRIVFNIPPKNPDKESRIIFLRHDGGVVGLLVDRVDDIVSAQSQDLELAPANVSGVEGEFFNHVYTRDKDLTCVLNIDRILQKD